VDGGRAEVTGLLDENATAAIIVIVHSRCTAKAVGMVVEAGLAPGRVKVVTFADVADAADRVLAAGGLPARDLLDDMFDLGPPG
jgi:hypothetical protein